MKKEKKREKFVSELSTWPQEPGVYIMRSSSGNVLYVGKAKKLRTRVRSYFRSPEQLDPKTRILSQSIESLEYRETGSEVEALILESQLIKKYQPRYNIRLKDDKSYPFLRVDYSHPFPRIYVARRPRKLENQKYFGPFPNSYKMRQSLQLAAKLFQIRDCSDTEFKNRERPCLSHQIGQCSAPCVSKVTESEYSKQVSDFIGFLNDGDRRLGEVWKSEMAEASDAMEFERAAQLRDRIRVLEGIDAGAGRELGQGLQVENLDIWTFFPAIHQLADEEFLDLVVIKIRDSKLQDRSHFAIEVQEQSVGENELLSTLTLQYYQNHKAPPLIVFPADAFIEDRQDLLYAIHSVQGAEDDSINLEFVSEKSEYAIFQEMGERAISELVLKARAKRSEEQKSLELLKKKLKLKKLPTWIDCIDISNFQGSHNVGACVVFRDGRKSKKDYRLYKIKSILGQDDFASMRELVRRRYAKEDSLVPSLLVVDGGIGQLNAVCECLKEFDCNFPVVSLAKSRAERDFKGEEVERSFERVFLPNRKNPIILKEASLFRLLTQIRDEAHRFAIQFHRKKRDKIEGS